MTLVELLVVIIVLAILLSLLLPVINGALRTARNSAVQAEINQIAQALEQFKSKYGIYPPSRVLLIENGDYSSVTSNASLSQHGAITYISGPTDPLSPGTGDITVGQLAQRSLSALRKIFPRVPLSTSGAVPNYSSGKYWYDFNGDGSSVTGGTVQAYVLHGHEALVFFLGGIPLYDPATSSYGITGFGKDPTNPFSNANTSSSMYNVNRLSPFFEFNPGRLFLDPNGTSNIPGYYDTLGSGPPTGASGINFYAYFCAYGSGSYDPNDVNFMTEADTNGNAPIGLNYGVAFPLSGSTNVVNIASSYAPNPYTTTLSETTSGTVTYWKPQSFQIISSGVDGLYGVAGQYNQSSQSTTSALPLDNTNSNVYVGTTDKNVRQREFDNLTNFKTGTLQ